MQNLLNQEQKDKLLSSVSKDWKTYQKTSWLISKIDKFSSTKESEKWKEKLKFLTDEELEDIQNPQDESVLQKVIQNFVNNEIISILSDFINYEQEIREIKVASHQSVNNIKHNAQMKGFSPQSFSDNVSSRAEIFQSVSNVGNDLIIDGDFSPLSSNKESFFSTKQVIGVEGVNFPALNKLIGQGAHGKVYQAIWRDKLVAIKKISSVNDREITKEIKALKRLGHENIIKYYGDYQKENDIYLIMEYANQGSLKRWIDTNQKNHHNWPLNLNFIKQITKGLSYLHSNKILHRDLKSDNILITQDNILKLTDFGLVKFLDSSNLSISGNKLTGTTRWMAPEVLGGAKHSYQSDIYSLGMVFWEICAKKTRPFQQYQNDIQVIFNVGRNKERDKDRPNEKETIPTNTPQDLKETIEFCWKENPNERIELIDIESELDRLEAFIEINLGTEFYQ